jgi:biopolymer transport protein ExbB/TolQ
MKTWLITAAIAIISAIISFLIVYCFSDRKKNIRNKFEDISEASINQ